MKNILFFVLQFSMSGTEVAIYDYAHYNETILNNKSYIITFNDSSKKEIGWSLTKNSFEKFKSRFPIIEISKIEDITSIIKENNITNAYLLTNGIDTDKHIFKFNDRSIWLNCKTIKHAVYNTQYSDGDTFCCLTELTNKKFNTTCPVLPHIVSLPKIETNLRDELNIPNNVKVFGYYGSYLAFNILPIIHSVSDLAQKNPNIYFLFMNIDERPFIPCKNIIHLPGNTSIEYKVKFINTCDAMIHGRLEGETFGLTIAEFAINEKNIISYKSYLEYNNTCGYVNAHFDILKDQIIQYNSQSEFEEIIKNFDSYKKDMSNNGYMKFTPEYVMNIFKNLIE